MRADADWLAGSRLDGDRPRQRAFGHRAGRHRRLGRAARSARHHDLGEALAPAIRLAEEGVPVTPRVAWDWAQEATGLARDEGGGSIYLNGRPSAARRARSCAIRPWPTPCGSSPAKGRDGFYAGEIAEDIVAHLGARGGLLTREDFARTEATWVEPISTSFAGHEILEIPPNGQGLTALIALNILTRFDLGRYRAGQRRAPSSARSRR